jgi:hypothetical protein
MQVRQIAQEIERIVVRAAEGANDAQLAQAIRELLATKSLAVQRHALLYVIKRKIPAEGSVFWESHPKTLLALQMHSGYAWLVRVFGDDVAELEHLRWILTSGHPLAERLMQLYLSDGGGVPYAELGGIEHLCFAHFDGRGPEAWLPLWGRALLFDENDELGSVHGSMLSVSFRDLWALWDSSSVPDDATCRLVVLYELWGVWENGHRASAARDAKALLDRMGDHLRLADASLNSVQHDTWEATRRRFWLPVKRIEAIEHHLKALKVWAQIQDPRPEKDGGASGPAGQQGTR